MSKRQIVGTSLIRDMDSKAILSVDSVEYREHKKAREGRRRLSAKVKDHDKQISDIERKIDDISAKLDVLIRNASDNMPVRG